MTTFGNCDLDENGICRKCGEPAPAVPGRVCWSDSIAIQPTLVQVDQEILRAVVEALEIGLDCIQSERAEHERSLGRKTRKNKIYGEMLDLDMRSIRESRDNVRALLGWKEIE